MRLLSVNLEYSSAWEPSVLPSAAAIITDAAPDVVAVQECPGQEHLEKLASMLGYTYRIAASPTGIHTGLLWKPGITELSGGDKYAERIKAGTWHGFTSSTLTCESWPSPITFVSAHLIPHDVDAAVGEARFLQTRVRREGRPGVFVGDLNHLPLSGPEPDWATIPVHNQASRTVLDQFNPETVVGDRRVGLALTRGGLTDVAAHWSAATGNESLLAHTGVYGRVRVDQAWVTSELVDAIRGYQRLDHRGVTDHHPILVELALEELAPIRRAEFH